MPDHWKLQGMKNQDAAANMMANMASITNTFQKAQDAMTAENSRLSMELDRFRGVLEENLDSLPPNNGDGSKGQIL